MKNLLRALVAACAVSMASGVSATVLAPDGNVWRQLTDTLNFSWDEIATACDPTTGLCSGSTGGVDFDGWIWASQADVAQLFQSLSGWDGSNVTQFSHSGPNPTLWAEDFLSSGFLTTSIRIGEIVSGIVRTVLTTDIAFNPYLFRNTTSDFASTDANQLTSDQLPHVGGWFFQASTSPTSVPAPQTLALLLVPALALVVRRSRRQRQSR